MTDLETGTRERLLDAAERLFAHEGIHATSLRRLTSEAGANLAAVNYHFGSKGDLVVAVLRRLVRPVNEERFRRLDALESAARAAGAPAPPLEPILAAFLGPPLEMATGARAEHIRRLLGRLHGETDSDVRRLFFAEFGDVLARFTEAIGRACPHLPTPDVAWRLRFTVGAMAHAMIDGSDPSHPAMDGCADEEPVDCRLRRLVAFVAAGFREPAYGERKETP